MTKDGVTQRNPGGHPFPFDLLYYRSIPGDMGELIQRYSTFSMIPPYPWGQWVYARIFNTVCRDLEGDVIELGVGTGGTSLLLGSMAESAGKKVYSFDSFEGLPELDKEKDSAYFKKGDYRSSNDNPDNLFERFTGAVNKFGLSKTIVPVKGFFENSLKQLRDDQRFCFAHVDCDIYESIHVSLSEIYDRVVDGGVIVIDDFFHPAQGPQRAASDFFNKRGINPVYHVSFPCSVFIFKGEEKTHKRYARSLDGNIYTLEWLRSDDVFFRILEAAVEASDTNQPDYGNRRLLLDLLKAEPDSGKDIYTYWKSLEDFWKTIQGRARKFDELPIIEI